MGTETRRLTVAGLTVEVVRKDVKNLHLGVYPPDGRVRVAAPLAVSDEAVRMAVITRLGWIRRQQAKFLAQPRQTARAWVAGETHYFLGERYRLRVVEQDRRGGSIHRTKSRIELHVPKGWPSDRRDRLFREWYRGELRALIPPLVQKWEPRIGVWLDGWGIRRMKTKWGSCNVAARHVLFNLELAKKPLRCLEYIVVHELIHLTERKHTERFIRLMDTHMPDWRTVRAELNAAPLADEKWTQK